MAQSKYFQGPIRLWEEGNKFDSDNRNVYGWNLKHLKNICETFFEYLRSNLFGRVLFIFVCL